MRHDEDPMEEFSTYLLMGVSIIAGLFAFLFFVGIIVKSVIG